MGCPADIAAAIMARKARYGWCIDTKNFEKLKELALPASRFSFCNEKGEPTVLAGRVFHFESPAAFAAWCAKLMNPMDTIHMFGPGQFEQVAPDTVEAVFSMEDQFVHKILGSWVEQRGGGYYYETWKLADGEWCIEELVLKRNYQKYSLLLSFAIFLQETLGVPIFEL
ncbi:hypothetical protein F5Y10DRAFT_290915 [Nemania abortiva]|nr:hypothetical protein F5Y10DRAFT_290915 [Nemania abortiva]